MSRPRIREFLLLWLGIELGTGTINPCIHEAGRCVAPVEDPLVEERLASNLLHADETTWLIGAAVLAVGIRHHDGDAVLHQLP